MQKWPCHDLINKRRLIRFNVFGCVVKHAGQCEACSAIGWGHGQQADVAAAANLQAQETGDFASHYVVAGAREAGVLLVCDHARNALPANMARWGCRTRSFNATSPTTSGWRR
jgi:hypothetical protein